MTTPEPLTPEDADTTDHVAMLLHSTTDAMVWADEFAKLYPSPDLDIMVGWFANAIEVGRMAGERAARQAPTSRSTAPASEAESRAKTLDDVAAAVAGLHHERDRVNRRSVLAAIDSLRDE